MAGGLTPTSYGGVSLVVDDAELRKLLKELVASGRNTLKPMKAIGEVHRRSVDKNFEAQGRPTKWKPLKESTLINRALRRVSKLTRTRGYQKLGSAGKQGARTRAFGSALTSEFLSPEGGRILIVTGALRRSFGKRVTDTSAVVGTPLKYSVIHQTGGTVRIPAVTAKPGKVLAFPHPEIPGAIMFRKSARAHSVKIPARPMIVVLKEDIEDDKKILGHYLVWGKLPPVVRR